MKWNSGFFISFIAVFIPLHGDDNHKNIGTIAMTTRSVVHRARGRGHGLIARMFSPGDLGRTLKPFVFLDFLSGDVKKDSLNFGYHPHSGIGTLTYSVNAAVDYTDTEGIDGTLRPGGLEWMKAGGGTWHKSNFHGAINGLLAFQFWFALPPVIEDGPSESLYIDPKQVPKKDNYKILIGEYDGLKNPIPVPLSMTVLDVVLDEPGTQFDYKVPANHATSFVMVYTGAALVGDDLRESTTNEIFTMDSYGDVITVVSSSPARLIIASAVPSPHPLSLGMYSVHTNPESLAKGESISTASGNSCTRRANSSNFRSHKEFHAIHILYEKIRTKKF